MFTFSLQRVLDLRAKREQDAAATLASARAEADQVRQECEVLERTRADGAMSVAAAHGGGITVGQLQNFGLVLQCLDEHLVSAREQVHQADAHVERCMSDFTSASQDRRVLDRLRDKHHQSWSAEEVQEDRKTMDAIALTRHVRSKSSLNGNSE